MSKINYKCIKKTINKSLKMVKFKIKINYILMKKHCEEIAAYNGILN